MTTGPLLDQVLDRIDTAGLEERVHGHVLRTRSLDDDAALSLRAGKARGEPGDTPPQPAADPVAFLESIAVRGFRGIGDRVELRLAPGPGSASPSPTREGGPGRGWRGHTLSDAIAASPKTGGTP